MEAPIRAMSENFYSTNSPSARDAATHAVSEGSLDSGPRLVRRLDKFTFRVGSDDLEPER